MCDSVSWIWDHQTCFKVSLRLNHYGFYCLNTSATKLSLSSIWNTQISTPDRHTDAAACAWRLFLSLCQGFYCPTSPQTDCGGRVCLQLNRNQISVQSAGVQGLWVQTRGANTACWHCTAARWPWWGGPLCSATPPAAAGCSAGGSAPRPAALPCPLSPARQGHTTKQKAVAQVAVAGTGGQRQTELAAKETWGCVKTASEGTQQSKRKRTTT